MILYSEFKIVLCSVRLPSIGSKIGFIQVTALLVELALEFQIWDEKKNL